AALFIARSAIETRHGRYFCLFDDALITLRYAWNLAHGDGLVWNPGERVEGITNLAWALYAAVVAFFFDKRLLPFAIQVSAVLLLIVTGFACQVILRRAVRREQGTETPFLLELAAFLL